MAIIGTLPNTISNGQAVDATPVMADFNFIVNQVNANANPIGTLTAPSGTRTLFHQAAAPLGWTQDVTLTDHTIQIIGSAGGGTGGAAGYSSMFQAQWTSDGHSLNANELGSHTHGINDPGHTHVDSGHSHLQAGGTLYGVGGANTQGGASFAVNLAGGTPTGASAAVIQASLTGISTQATGNSAAHFHTKTFNAKYVTMIMCAKQ